MKPDCAQLDRVFHDFMTLKKLRRTGWQLRGIRDGESLADHCFGVVLLTYMLAPVVGEKINRGKALAMAVVHELGETRVGDIPFTALKYFPEKSEIELQAVQDILSPMPDSVAQESLALFREFEDNATIEARFVRAIDKLDMLITAAEYEKAGYSGLSDFWHNSSTFKCLSEFPELSAYAEHLRDRRDWRVAGKK